MVSFIYIVDLGFVGIDIFSVNVSDDISLYVYGLVGYLGLFYGYDDVVIVIVFVGNILIDIISGDFSMFIYNIVGLFFLLFSVILFWFFYIKEIGKWFNVYYVVNV